MKEKSCIILAVDLVTFLMGCYYVYILSNWTGDVLYTGITNNLQRRVWEHKNHLLKGFTHKYKVEKLVYFEQAFEASPAIAREKQIKSWRRSKKIALIEQLNPAWNDLSDGWYKDPSLTLGMTGKKE